MIQKFNKIKMPLVNINNGLFLGYLNENVLLKIHK